MLVPVPGGTSDVSNFLDGGQNTGTIHEVIANIASHTISAFVIGVALI